MISSLRTRLAASHSLPILLLTPILGLYLLHSLESFYTQTLLDQLTNQAELLQTQVDSEPDLVQNPESARSFLFRIARLIGARVLLLSPDSVVLASSRKEDADRLDRPFSDAAVVQALQGIPAQGVGPGLVTEVAYVVLPLQNEGKLLGAIRVSYEIADVQAQFNYLRWLALGGVAITGLVGLALGLALAASITRPLLQLSASVARVAQGDYRVRVQIPSRDEIGRLAHNFNWMAERLEKGEEIRQRQLAAITHELARPLTGMLAALDTLRDGADADLAEREILYDGVTSEVTRLQRMLGTLQSVQKHMLQPIELKRARLDLPGVINSVAFQFEPLATQAGLRLVVQVPRDLPAVYGDQDRLVQVLTNLLDNSCKFTPRGGNIVIEGGDQAENVWIAVSDTGEGIAAEEMPQLFQEFYRGASSRSPEKRGMGLGLAIARDIVSAHGGTIRVESVPAKGSRFVFTLPKA